MVDLANYLFRALSLLGLAIAPRLFSPDPATPKNLALALLLPLAAFAGLLWGAAQMKKRVGSLEARVSATLVWVSVAAALAGAIYFSGPRAPLARGAAPIALVVWPTLAALAATLAGQFLGSNWKRKRTAATALVIAGGIYVHADAVKYMGDAAFQWKTALDRDAANEPAFEQVTRALIGQGRLVDANKRADACLKANPTACTCLVTRTTIAMRKGETERAVTAGADAAKICPNVTAARAVNVEALVAAGKLAEADAEAEQALTLADDPSRAHAAKATVLLAQGKIDEAQAEAQKAQGGAGGRDATLVLVQMAITNGDLDGAEKLLKSLQAASPQDADVAYNLALVADRKNKYNDARNGYLAALKLDPTYKAARYNLAILTYRRGVLEESKNHAKKFAEMAPNDPRTASLMQMVFGDPPKAPAPGP